MKGTIDAHIHLIPPSAASPIAHAWMLPSGPLTRPYTFSHYQSAISSPTPLVTAFERRLSVDDEAGGKKSDEEMREEGAWVEVGVKGFVYVETDRRLGDPAEGFDAWAKQPMEEVRFLRGIVEAQTQPTATATATATTKAEGRGPRMFGIVAWAPMHDAELLEKWLDTARREGGEEMWALVRGFRCLLQGIKEEEELKRLLTGGFEACVKVLEAQERPFTFDIGVDARQSGIWQVKHAVEMVKRVHAREPERYRVSFVLDHLCKPDLEHPPKTQKEVEEFDAWTGYVYAFAKYEKVYMKLSGGFSEMGNQDHTRPWPIATIVGQMKPWLDVIFDAFGPERIMFGSDWPVCNVSGPGERLSWVWWQAVVREVVKMYCKNEEEADWVWRRTAARAYLLDEYADWAATGDYPVP